MQVKNLRSVTLRTISSVALAITCVIAGATAAQAEDASSDESVVASALANASGDVVSFVSSGDPDVAATGHAGGVSVVLPQDPSEAIALAGMNAEEVSVSLPRAAAAEEAQLTGHAVTYGGESASTVPLLLQDGTLQIVSVLESSQQSGRLEYQIEPESGGRLVQSADGGFAILNRAGDVVGSASAPWARDSSGSSVPTYYAIAGTKVTQVIDLAGLTPHSFPVVADPAITVSSYQYVATGVTTRTQQPNYNKLIGGCKVGASNSTCTITGSYTQGTTVNGSLGITADQVAATLGISVSTSVTGSMGCTSPAMPAGSSYKAYIMGTFRYYTLEKWKVTKAGGQTVRRLEATASNQVAFTPINMIYCTR